MTKKSLIRSKAAIEIDSIDIMVELREDSPDAEKVKQLIEQKCAKKTEKAKLLANAYIQLKGILSEDQLEKCTIRGWLEEHKN